MPAIEPLAQVLADLTLGPGQLEREPHLGIVKPVVHRADLDPQPAVEDFPFSRTEARHATWHRL